MAYNADLRRHIRPSEVVVFRSERLQVPHLEHLLRTTFPKLHQALASVRHLYAVSVYRFKQPRRLLPGFPGLADAP